MSAEKSILNKNGIPSFVTDYIDSYKKNNIVLNIERIKLIKQLEDTIFKKVESGGLYFDEKHIAGCINFAEKWYFPLEPFQKFIISFIFLYHSHNQRAYYKEFLIMMGRGGGKNGLISVISHYLISELHGIENYNGSVVANSEEQAKTSFEEIYDAINKKSLLQRAFYKTKLEITSNATNSKFKFHTANPKTKDGGRQGFVIFDEIHAYENASLVNVYKSGMGKKKDSRKFYIGTDGYVREGYLDSMKNKANNILDGEHPDSKMFVFICKLDDVKEVSDETMWEKANPMFSQPMSEYAEILYEEVKEEFLELNYDSTSRTEFMTKRMNLPEEDMEKIVASWEDIMQTSRPMPLLNNRTAIVGVDYANAIDFAAVGFLFRIDNNYVWHSHSFARKEFLDTHSLGPPIGEWEKKGYLTIVEAPTIDPKLMVDWVKQECERLNLTVHKVMVDNFRYDITRPAFEDAGYEMELLKYMPSIHAQLSPRVETIFRNHQVIWDDNPLMRWYTNNTAVKIKKDGNKEFIKKDPVRRKTDGFHAFLHALYRSDEVVGQDLDKSFDMLELIDF
ncbi:terminase TerL endonuclease subunit [Salinicoccus halodurans]|uniref:Terminase n=1 Tax=Salinicoccus halodurans TaxID=407035 RepID=A0A0F7HLD6_9STAP|nr:terminase TerL endonuclease subunit [Salinicoccus halodurans]AKG74372.1 terminase [Salinicoccus halodurans]SFK95078.1 Phage terminase-like protein, large subunit, contains N-terminal HTH domain [Salinicoccus halodurans]